MKFKDLVKFIEDEVKQAAKSKGSVEESTVEQPTQCKPVTINIKREDKTPKEIEMEEDDFAEIMFHKLDESFLRKRIRAMLIEDFLPGGMGDKINSDTLDQKELSMGIKVEMEHTNDEKKAKEIATDHLTENPHYYTELKTAGIDENDKFFIKHTPQNSGVEKSGQKIRSGKEVSHEVYHNLFSEACSEVISFAKKRGYDVNEDDWFNQVSTGPRKPNPGQTNRYSIELTKNGAPTNKFIHFQVYGMESGKYELNAYLSSK